MFLRISLGVKYSQIIEKSEFVSIYDVELEEDKWLGTTYYQDGSIVKENEVVVNHVERESIEKRINSIRFISIPVAVRYTFLKQKSYSVSIGFNASYSLNQNYNGFTSLSDKQESYNITLDSENKFATSGAFSYGVALYYLKPIFRNTDLMMGINYTKLKGINNEIYLIDQQYNSLTLSAGISRKF